MFKVDERFVIVNLKRTMKLPVMSRSIVLSVTYANRPPGYSVLVEIAMMKRVSHFAN